MRHSLNIIYDCQCPFCSAYVRRARLQELATNIKAAGIQLYVIQFKHSSGALATLLKSVATSPDAPFYHFAPDSASLQTVFQEVANHLSQLRLSK